MLRIASVGYGDIAQRSHFPSLARLKDKAKLVAICGRNAERAAQCADRFGIPDYYTDIDEMLARDDIDAVMVVTPPEAHCEPAVKAVRAGKHVLLEKPMTPTMDEAYRILEAVEGSGVTFFPLPYVASPSYDALRLLVDKGAIGEVTNIECHKSHRGPTHADWFYKKEIAGGGVLFDLGIYALGAIAHVFGPAARVSAMLGRRYDTRTMDDGSTVEPDVEDIAFVNLWLESGVGVTINANFNGYLSHHETRSRLVVFGREGMIHFGAPGGSIYVHRADGKYDHLPLPFELAEFDGYTCAKVTPEKGQARSILEHFIGMIEAGDTSTLLLRQQIHVVEIMLKSYESGGLDHHQEITTRF